MLHEAEFYCLWSSPAGAVVVSLCDQPTLRDVVCFVVLRVAPKWYDLGLALDVQPFVLDTISQQQRCPDQPRAMFVRWLEGSPGTGSQPRTWQSVLAAVEMICGSAAMEDIRTAVQTPRIPTAGESSFSFPLIKANVFVCSCKHVSVPFWISDTPEVTTTIGKWHIAIISNKPTMNLITQYGQGPGLVLALRVHFMLQNIYVPRAHICANIHVNVYVKWVSVALEWVHDLDERACRMRIVCLKP